MLECTNCGASLKPGDSRCPACGVATPSQRAQRVCINCGSPTARDARICIMCGHTIDALPRQAMTFSYSWPGILGGLIVVLGIVYWFFRVDPTPVVAELTTTPSHTPATPTSTLVATRTPTPLPPPTLAPTRTPTPAPPTSTPAPVVHTVQRGDSLLAIANIYETTVDAIATANSITENTILSIGQRLLIPIPSVGGVAQPPPVEPTEPGPVITYTIKSGDIVSQIAVDYDVSLEAIEQANPGVNLDFLSIGQVLVIPLNPPTPTPTPSTTPTPTFTPPPPFPRPALLLPANGTLIEGDNSTVLLSWTAGKLLPKNTYYVVHLTAPNGQVRTFWTQTTSYRLPAELRPSALETYIWYVVVMEEIRIDQDKNFYGNALSLASPPRSFSWR